jgi:acyl-homoserine lactone acylase PvdQ
MTGAVRVKDAEISVRFSSWHTLEGAGEEGMCRSWILLAVLVGAGCVGGSAADEIADSGVEDSGAADTGTSDTGTADSGETGSEGAAVRLVRDEFGTPHIEADSFAAALYGLGRAMAEDRLFQMQVRRLRAQGRLSEFFAIETPVTKGENDLNARLLDLDKRHRTMGYAHFAAQAAEQLSEADLALMEAFVAGVNDHLAEREVLGPAFATAGIASVEDWTVADTLMAWEVMSDLFSNPLAYAQAEIDNLNDCAGGTCPEPSCGLSVKDENAAVVSEPADGEWPPGSGNPVGLAGAPLLNLDPSIDVKASHGVAIAGARTSSGKPMLFGEPQIMLEAPSTWYESHIVVASEGVNVRGISFAGSPGMLLYVNAHHGQTLTAGSGDTADLFEVDLDGSDTYTVDGQQEALVLLSEPIKVRGSADVPHQVAITRYGPVVDELLSDVPTSRAFAMRRSEVFDPSTHTVLAALDMARATTLDDYREAANGWSSPTVNALYAGVDADSGTSHIAYHALTRIAERSAQDIGGRDLTGQHPVDGADSSKDWTGFYSLDWNPHVIDPAGGVLFSGNHLAVGSWYSGVVYGGFRGNGDTYRSLELRARLAEWDEGGQALTVDDVHGLHVDARSEALKAFTNALQLLQDRSRIPADEAISPATNDEKAARALTALQRWQSEGSGELDQRSVGYRLGLRVLSRMITNARSEAFACSWGAAEGGAAHFLKAFAADPTSLGAAEANTLVAAAAQAFDNVKDDLGEDVTAWSGAALRDVEPYEAAYHKDFLCLQPGEAGMCSFDPTQDVSLAIAQSAVHTISSTSGSSWPFTVHFADELETWALLAPGASEDPGSPHFDDRVSALLTKGSGDPSGVPPVAMNLSEVTVASEESWTWGP